MDELIEMEDEEVYRAVVWLRKRRYKVYRYDNERSQVNKITLMTSWLPAFAAIKGWNPKSEEGGS